MEKIRTELDAGYQRIKIKIAPGWDYDVIKAVREEFGDIRLMGDANSAYTLADIDLFKRMDEFELMMFEQPLPHDDIVDHAKLQAEIRTPVCLDESVKSPDDARKAIELKSGRIINVKLGRVGGHAQAKLVGRDRRDAGIPDLVRRHARKRHRARAQHRDVHAGGLYDARRCFGSEALLARGYHRAGGRGFGARGRSPRRRGRGSDLR